MQAHYFTSFVRKIDNEKKKEIEEKINYQEIINDFGFKKQS